MSARHVDRRAEAFVGEHGRVDAVSDPAQLVDRRAADRRPCDRAAGPCQCGCPPWRWQNGLPEADAHQQSDQPLLGPVVDVSLEAAAFSVAGGDDPCPRRLQFAFLSTQLGVKPLVLQRQLHRNSDLADDHRVVEQSTAVNEHGDGPTPSDERRGDAPVGRWQGHRLAVGVDVAPSSSG